MTESLCELLYVLAGRIPLFFSDCCFLCSVANRKFTETGLLFFIPCISVSCSKTQASNCAWISFPFLHWPNALGSHLCNFILLSLERLFKSGVLVLRDTELWEVCPQWPFLFSSWGAPAFAFYTSRPLHWHVGSCLCVFLCKWRLSSLHFICLTP